MVNNTTENKQHFQQIMENQPRTKFVYFKRLGDNFVGDVIDVPIDHVPMTIKNNIEWELQASCEQMDEDIAELFVDEEKKDSVASSSKFLYERDKSVLPELEEFCSSNKIEVPPLPEPVSKEEFETIMGKTKKK